MYTPFNAMKILKDNNQNSKKTCKNKGSSTGII